MGIPYVKQLELPKVIGSAVIESGGGAEGERETTAAGVLHKFDQFQHWIARW